MHFTVFGFPAAEMQTWGQQDSIDFMKNRYLRMTMMEQDERTLGP